MTTKRAWAIDHLLPPRQATALRASRSGGRAIAHLVPPSQVAVDVGANIGLYSYWMARRAAWVHAFEPQPNLHRKLVRGSAANVVCHEVALSDSSGTAVLNVPEGSRGEASLGNLEGRVLQIEVTTTTLDSFEFNHVGFLKIDVEGHEESVLRGGEATISRCRPILFIEIEERHNPGGLKRIVEHLERHGYGSAYFMRGDGFVPLREFSVGECQEGIPPLSQTYVNNFLFLP